MASNDATHRNGGTSPPADTPPEGQPSLREWAVRNGPSLVIAALVFIFLYYKFDAAGLWSIVKAALGLGFVIFIHELGHFAVAKWCDVHVETFSIGFGPALPGCKFKYGETTYMIALFPLGGYVKMVGEGAESDEGDDDPRSFKNKSVWQRMAIISAGVTMNVILAFVCFIAVFRGPGKQQQSAVVGQVVPGSAAWAKDIPGGAWIREIGDRDSHVYFSTIMPEVMLSGSGAKVPLVYSFPPHLERREVNIEPRMDESGTRKVIGILPAEALKLTRRPRAKWEIPGYPGTPAATAEPPFAFGDTVVGCTDPRHRNKDWEKDWTYLRRDPRDLQKFQRDYFEFADRLIQLADQPITVRVERKEGEEVHEVSIRVKPAYHQDFGFRMEMGPITAVRNAFAKSPPGKGERAAAPKGEDNKAVLGDIIEQVEVKEADGKVTRFLFPPVGAGPVHPVTDGQELDPMRLRYELRQWAERTPAGPKTVRLLVRRQNPQRTGKEYEPAVLELPWSETDEVNHIAWKFAREAPVTAGDPTSIPELGICFQVRTRVAGLAKGAEVPLKKGDVIKKVRFRWVNQKGEEKPGDWLELKDDQWAYIAWAYQRPAQWAFPYWYQGSAAQPQIDLLVNDKEITLTSHEDRTWPLAGRGLLLAPDQRIQRADSIGEAIVMGLDDTWTKIKQIYETLRSIVTGQLSPKTLGGPVTIARYAYAIAGENFWEFVYFLGLISINLAVVNFLPIPILDGGHMVFLIYEKIRGKPASEQVRSGATIVGLLLLASLMIFVLILDFSKIWGK